MKVFEQARKSYGTDEDILFIFKESTKVENSSWRPELYEKGKSMINVDTLFFISHRDK